MKIPLTQKSLCGCCVIRERCLPAGLNDEEVLLLDQQMEHRLPIKKGALLYSQGQVFDSLYAISTGSFKTRILHEDGRSQITGFQLSGEMLGLDAISEERHVCDAIALEDSTVCKIAYDSLTNLESEINPLQRSFNKTLSKEIVRDQSIMLLLGSMRAEERVAAFLVNLSERYHARQQSASELVLRMTREDIGNYLGLKLETVSRILSRFAQENLINVQGRLITITDVKQLQLVTLSS
ncbi:MAG: transcriptional regulator [Ferrovum sp. 37-45-19]|uniref:fumarate/nitrate reduction transcriptional regulator Fnr n=1 Tax=Ferrovum sp. JA12 TaxID=1356299 RepID=UPI0007032649|nr:fumarate/nitrate reduction transcriptional regulator Fnr [Ferrovum sp. JA12]OYV79475.1 MAG: transcriptional regulator [Ferrovum sp. 21-44-67]OYV94218.1 MAG: transcriptional regulator [Ferrovum sp. 37-45-19]OZB31749.1 MAG: transcriptional regulator [Ferrovum sp. 34-44-207]HQT81692.1 fumarate/nitrate reduction transcriptional regulator Fnr [Ferrovaceae bacterium]KRH78368.1 anaerobic regulatory protein [Ferrovum sp. JA12]